MKDYTETMMYQIYPLGLLNALPNEGKEAKNIRTLIPWTTHLTKLNINTVYFSPLFASDYHGYDTINFGEVDPRIGNNQDFKAVCDAFHDQGIKILLDGVFNHVGRGFWAFQDVLKYRQDSLYCDWFYIDFAGNSPYQDGFYYEGWEGHYELVKLNLHNQGLLEHIFSNVKFWIEYFGIDGLRLDVAYMLDRDFLRQLKAYTKSIKPDFFLVGETIHGDYNQIVNPELLDSCTNYECFKGIYSSFNDKNFFEISFSLNRQFGPENWTLYKGKHLVNFVDNHDVSRIASLLKDPLDLPLVYALLFSMPGIPCLYYGSEWGVKGVKEQHSDDVLRPAFVAPSWNELTDFISLLAKVHQQNPVLSNGDYQNVYVNNQQFLFKRANGDEEIIIAINLSEQACEISCQLNGRYTDLLTQKTISITPFVMPAKSVMYLKKD